MRPEARGGTFPAGFVDEVRGAVSLSAIVQEHVKLKRAGRTLKGLCPFHGEKTPSFHVDEAKGLYYCFGCSAGGDVFKFVMEREALSFPEAVRHLAARAGLPVPEDRPRGPGDELRDRILEINQRAQAALAENLRSDAADAVAARRYLAERGIGDGLVETFGLGWAPDRWDFLVRRLEGSFERRELTASGLAVTRRDGSGLYDRFRSRVTFPIRALSDRVVAFGGRIVGEGEPKYLNSPETPVFDKGRHLFGLDRARGAIRREGRAVLAEGYMDVLALHSAGIDAAVAVLGTALTADQARLLARFTDVVVVAFDGDAAGQKAAQRGIPLLLEAGLEVRVWRLPAGSDPDDFVRERGEDAARRVVESAPGFFDFLLEVAAAEHDVAVPSGRVSALAEVLPFLTRVGDRVLRSELTDQAAHALSLRRELVQDEVRRAVARAGRSRGARETAAPVAVAAAELDASQAERTLLSWLCSDERARQAFRARVRGRSLESLERSALFSALGDAPDGRLDVAAFVEGLEDEAHGRLLRRCAVDPDLEPIDSEELEERVGALIDELGISASRQARREKATVERQLAEAIRDGDAEAAGHLRDELHRLAREMHA